MRISTFIKQTLRRRIIIIIVLFFLTTICATPLMLIIDPVAVLVVVGLTTTGWALYIAIRYRSFWISKRGWILATILFLVTLLIHNILEPIYTEELTSANLIAGEAFGAIILILMFATWIFFINLFVSSILAFYEHHRFIGSWKGFCLIVLLFLITAFWFRKQSYLIEITDKASFLNWWTAMYLLPLIIALFLSTYISGFLLLWRDVDAGIILFIIILAANGLYVLIMTNNFERLENVFQTSGDMFLWGLPVVWAMSMLCIIGLAVLIRFGQLVMKELTFEFG